MKRYVVKSESEVAWLSVGGSHIAAFDSPAVFEELEPAQPQENKHKIASQVDNLWQELSASGYLNSTQNDKFSRIIRQLRQ